MLAQGVLGGISSGMLFAPVMTCVSHYFHTRRAAALGVTVSGSSIGGVLFPIALTQMLRNKSLGFGWSVRIVGFLMLFMVSIAMATIKERLPPRQGKILLPSAFTRASYTLVTFGIFFMMWGMFTPFFYLPQYAQSHGMSSHLSSYILSIVNAASVPGRILPGLAADKLGRYNILIINGACAGILLLCWIATSSDASIIVFSVLYGFFSGGIVSLMSPCIAQVTPSPDQIGTHLGMSMAIIGLAGLTGTPICGALLERYGGYTQAAVFSGVVMLVGAFLVTVARFNLQAKLLKIVWPHTESSCVPHVARWGVVVFISIVSRNFAFLFSPRFSFDKTKQIGAFWSELMPSVLCKTWAKIIIHWKRRNRYHR